MTNSNTTSSPPKPSASTVLRIYNFRLLWLGQGTSLLGDQFFLIAMPWLVLKLTDDPLALGTILAVIGIPRALVMLLGGVATDRYSARTIMITSDLLRTLLVGLLAVLVLTSTLQLWMLYVLGVIFGLISGFFIPASSAMVPQLVKSEELVIANSIYQGTSTLISSVGPVLAGGVIALFAHAKTAGTSSEMVGIAAAMAFDAFTFLVSVVTLWFMRWQPAPRTTAENRPNILRSIREGITFMWQNDLLRTLFILMVAANFIFAGPVVVGMPVLVDNRLQGSAGTYGLITGAYGAGNLLGILLTSRLLGIVRKRMGAFMVAVIVSFGVALALLGFLTAAVTVLGTTLSTVACFVVLLAIGVGNGMLSITLISFLQLSTPKEMLGRVMSLVMLAGVGLVPISQALAGGLIKLSLEFVFIGAGVLMALVAVWLAFQPITRTIHELLQEAPATPSG